MRKSRSQKGNRELAFFEKLVGSTVSLEFTDGGQTSGNLVWVSPYSVLLKQKGVERLYWKHALRGMSPANGRGDA